MSTEAQIAANQANSQKSTGPKTEAGKAASSQDSWKHGLTFGVFQVLATESQSRYEILQKELIDEHKPATATEAILVERMAQHHWLRNCAVHFQNQCIDSGEGMNIPQFNLFLRYETMHERAFRNCLNDLLKLRTEREKLENGFASQTHKQRCAASTFYAANRTSATAKSAPWALNSIWSVRKFAKTRGPKRRKPLKSQPSCLHLPLPETRSTRSVSVAIRQGADTGLDWVLPYAKTNHAPHFPGLGRSYGGGHRITH